MRYGLVLLTVSALAARTWTVCVDPGHGGSDPGAQGAYYTEKQANLDVGLWVKHYLEQAGLPDDTVIVGMTRTTDVDVSLADRCNYANTNGFDRFVSVHHNAFDGTVQGTETYCHPSGSSYSFDMRDSVQPRLLWAFGYNDRGTQTADYYVLRNTVMPAILGEASFIDYHDGYDESWRFYTSWNRHPEREGFAYADGVARHLGIGLPEFPNQSRISGNISLSPTSQETVQVFCYRNSSDSLAAWTSRPGPGPYVLDSLLPDTYDLVFWCPGYNPEFVSNLALYADTSDVNASLVSSDPVMYMDNTDPNCYKTGSWNVSEWSSQLWGINYIWAGSGPSASALFMPDIPRSGNYQVSVWFTQGFNRSQNAMFIVKHDAGQDTFFLDQTTGGGQWHQLGVFQFSQGVSGFVRIENTGTEPDKVVIADAVRFWSQVDTREQTSGARPELWVCPTGQYLWISDPQALQSIAVYDPCGRLVFSSRTRDHRIDMPKLARGTYVVVATWKGFAKTQQVFTVIR